MLAVGAGDLAAEPRRRHHLARVGEAGRVERAAQALERVEIGLGVHRGHVRLLVDADAVLTGDRAVGVDTRLDDQAGELLGLLRLAGAGRVVADEGVKIAVAGVEHVGDLEVVFVGELVDPPQHLDEPGAGDDAVLDVVGGGDPAHRGERRLARPPDERPLGLGERDADIRGPGPGAERHQMLEPCRALLVRTVELDEQRRAGVEAVPGAGRLLGRLDREPVHHLDRAGHDPGADDRTDRLAGVGGIGEERDERPHGLRGRNHPHRDLRGHAERPLGPDERPEQVISGGVAVEFDD